MRQRELFAQQLIDQLRADGLELYIVSPEGEWIGSGKEGDQPEGGLSGREEDALVCGQETWHIIPAVRDERHQVAVRAARAALESAIALFGGAQGKSHEEMLVEELLGPNDAFEARESMLTGICQKHGFDTALPRAILLITLEAKTNRYFNINLDLGYDVSVAEARRHIVQVVRNNRYLNRQDIVAPYGFDQIVVIKSFMPVNNTGKYYQALETIAVHIARELDSSKIFQSRLAHGKVCHRLSDLRESYREAELLMRLGSHLQQQSPLYRAEELLTEFLLLELPEAIVERTLAPLMQKLKADGNENCHEMLRILQTYLDTGYNISLAAQKLYLHRNTVAGKIEKYKNLTGLNPAENFNDAIITRLLSVYLCLEDFKK